MHNILSYEEFENLKKEKKIDERQEKPLINPKKNNDIEYILFYPDNSKDRYYSGKYLLEKNDKILELQIENGKITTDDIEIKDILIKSGFIFLYQRSKENE